MKPIQGKVTLLGRMRPALPMVATAFLLVGATGCGRRPIIVQAPPATVIHSAAPAPTGRDVIIVREAPPAPKPETMTAQPSPQQQWIPGYWVWRGGEHVWVPGHWEMPPQPGATWVPARWEQRAEGWAFVEGGWR